MFSKILPQKWTCSFQSSDQRSSQITQGLTSQIKIKIVMTKR